MAKRSAALLLYRLTGARGLEVLIVHMGGPFWSSKNARAWSIPKGEYEDDEEPLPAAFREFEEETGSAAPAGPVVALGETKQPSGKVITTYAIAGNFDVSTFRSNTFEMEWPKGSGRIQEFPEADRAAWMDISEASRMLVKGQVPIIEALADFLRGQGSIVDPVQNDKPAT